MATVLAGGLGTLPLAPLADLTPLTPAEVVRQMKGRIAPDASPGEAGRLWTATYVLMGLRDAEALIGELLEGVQGMEESVTYQAIIRRGREKAGKKAAPRKHGR